ncbi:Cobalt ABC superfamily ATP binding cassette transporter, ABC protein [Lactobacillus helveticus CIRM-BIA 101]|nr:Cobalt ABC superfamily ATP binding cassette transporter, ABC protein [Lactobacillus helveticus CIRM-BIA 101]
MIAGNTGSGKTTLLNHLKKELMPKGARTGDVQITETPVADMPKLVSAQTVGYVAQDPQIQSVMATVIEELAFPLENIGCPSNEIERRITELANFLGLDQNLDRQIHQLSGGQLQLVNLASVLILRPKLILLDEPTSQLDPLTAQHFLTVLGRINQELGITIMLTEHRLSTVAAMANRMILLQDHHLTFDGDPHSGLAKMATDAHLTYFVPSISKLFLDQQIRTSQLPISVADAQSAIRTHHLQFQSVTTGGKVAQLPTAEKPILTVNNISFSFDGQHNVLHHLNLAINPGTWLAIIGKNGSGKSTLLTLICGLMTPQHGKIRFFHQLVWKMAINQRMAKLAFLSQTPSLQFTANTVREELEVQAAELRLPDAKSQVDHMIEQFHLNRIEKQNPFDISGGQQQLVGLAIALMATPDLLVLDEPTKGLDPYTKIQVGHLLKQYQQAGMTIVIASHDMEFCAKFADKCTFMFDGHLNTLLATQSFFTDNFFFTTPINRIARDQVKDALLPADLKLANRPERR